MNIGLYFGSFNPIHHGHLIIANHIVENTELKQVWFVVSPQNPFKPAQSLLNEYQRLHMVRQAIDGSLKLKESEIEFNLPKPSYTVDTLAYLSEKYPRHQFTVIMGSDSYQNLPRWKNAEVILKNYSIVIYKRPGFEVEALPGNVRLLNAPLLDISSTYIRKLVKEGKSIRYMVPDIVEEEIEKNGYYK